MFDFFKRKDTDESEMSDKRKLVSKVIVGIVLIGGLILGTIFTDKEIPLPINDVFRFRFSVIDGVMLLIGGIIYLIVRHTRRRNNGK